jgi:DNA gyrase subunit A
VVGILDVTDKDDLMIINKSGIMIRTSVSELRVMGRNTQGVRLIRLNDEDEISSIAKIEKEEEVEMESPENQENPETPSESGETSENQPVEE